MWGVAWGDVGGIVALATLISAMFAGVAKFALVKPLEDRIDRAGTSAYTQLKSDNMAAVNGCRDELKHEILGARDELKHEIHVSREEARALVRNHVADMHRPGH